MRIYDIVFQFIIVFNYFRSFVFTIKILLVKLKNDLSKLTIEYIFYQNTLYLSPSIQKFVSRKKKHKQQYNTKKYFTLLRTQKMENIKNKF